MKPLIAKVLKKALEARDIKIKRTEIENLIEIPPSHELGDYAFPCFFLSEKLKKNPHQIALEIRGEIGEPPATDFQDIQTKGGYINFFVNRKSLARQVTWEVLNEKKNYGSSNEGKRKKVVVEFSSPNIAKPFGIGHLRSTIIGNSLSNIFEFQNFNVTRINYFGDWGTQFGKLILGYEKWGNEKKLLKDPIDHLFKIYVKANKKIYEEDSREWFKKMEGRDRKAIMLWRLFKNLSLREFKEIYKNLGVKFDVYESESDYNKKAKKIIEELKEKNLLIKSEGALIIDLEEYGLGKAVIEKSDGTTLYMTRDLAAAISRYEKWKFEKMIYEVGQEQKLYFKQLFKTLELLGYKWAKKCIHVEHGLYLGKSGKKLSTRKGETVFMDTLLKKSILLAKREIKKRDKKIPKTELEKRAFKIAISAIFYGDLKNNRKNDIAFDMNKSLSFDGDTGPYILYSYARASSIVRKSEKSETFKIPDLEDKEIELIKKLLEFKEIVVKASKTLNPAVIANYSYQLCQIFNEFYQNHKVIGSEQETFRLVLTESFRQVLRNALHLLGIETLEKM